MIREVLARFGIEFDENGLKLGKKSLVALGLAAITTAIAIGVGLVNALRKVALEMIAFGDETAKSARTLGVSAEQLMRWRFAAERAGVPAQQLTGGIRRLQRNIVDANDGLTTSVRAFGAIGVAFKDAHGNARQISDILPDVADGFLRITNTSERSARAQQLFGRSGALLLPFFENGSAGLAEMDARFNELTGGSFGDFFAMSEASQDSLSDWDLTMKAVKIRLATELLPSLTKVVTAVANMVGWFQNATRGTRPFRAIILGLALAIGTLGAAILFGLMPLIFPLVVVFGVFAAAIAAVVLIVDDLLTLFDGGDSVIGRFLDSLFGAGTAARVAERVQLAWQGFVQWIRNDGIPMIRSLGRFLAALWEQAKPGLISMMNFFVGIGEFIDSLPAKFAPVVAFFQRLATTVADFFDSVASQLENFSGVFGALGIDVQGHAAPAAAAAPQTPAAHVAPRAPGARAINMETTNNVVVQGAPQMTPAELQSRIADGVHAANQRSLRTAERALTTAAG